MSQNVSGTVRTIAAALLLTTAAMAAEEDAFAKDLMATIALQGLPCDHVVQAKRNGDSDYDATCKNGYRYHIYVNPQGRVVVDKL
jgi:hypothetical protein